ncbi:hypothetical protein KC332_g6082 [Hortaea werneckii]|uniref:Uncharacterized protein n=2 Tax=Hortaea werneckii TaxID=91943 RepID=A0A3M7ISJ2_HORWE|nr:hypothetical protein KC358_g4850 [Hortaea werneckii]KAI6845106.1 hypothetical protein KC350_g4610 [Hortaea werneckii]KAI6937922.1 hypothetical protein KC341_g5259 [Hortaea werneckii]KAI6940317.1 hypothetical protein KC348_g5036 [Hortaea werneckii]KAI6973535.1 hypothetical protein KC321_g5621 [Hortaea werneckii]
MDFGSIKRKVSLSSRKLGSKASTDSIQKSSKAELEPYNTYSSPLPQAQWSEIPLPFRPKDWVGQRHHNGPSHAKESHLRPPAASISGQSLSRTSPAASVQPSQKIRRRPGALRDLAQRSITATADGSDGERALLHPQRNQHVDDYSTVSDQSRASPRSISQPNTPSHLQTRFDESQPTPMPSLGIPRSPICPPTGRRRMHSDSGVQDDAFRNESDFRLFVEATAGLEPEQPPKPKPDSLHYPSDTSPHHYGPSQPYDIVSPTVETPTTLHALQGIAQMPKSASPPHRRRPLETPPLDPIAFDLSLHSGVPPSRSLRPPTDSSSTFGGVGESPLSSDEDEELPDYAASQAQAQAQAAQRVEAARRAQELQRRWQEGAKRRGF